MDIPPSLIENDPLAPKPFATFVDDLYRNRKTRKQITAEIQKMLKNPQDWKRIVAALERQLEDLIVNESVEVKTVTARGSYEDPFQIRINRFGPLRFVSANEFDDVGYFDSTDKARRWARWQYSMYL
jgi:hypothetical protein